jgi:hypothetical protein
MFSIFIMEDVKIQILKKVGLATIAGISGIIAYTVVSNYFKKKN